MRLRLSQAQLTLLDQCPRKFQHVVLDQLGLSLALDQRLSMEWGNQFHLVMQQQSLGLPLVLDEAHPIQTCVAQFRSTVPELFAADPNRVQDSEHRRRLQVQDYLLTVVYDALILEGDRAEILDWKTYAKPQNTRRLENTWQTRLYLYALAETSDYPPDQLTMTYWFIPPHLSEQTRPTSVSLHYSQAWHQRVQQELTQLLEQLTRWLETYEQGEDFPQVAEAKGLCRECPFVMRCQRASVEGEGDLQTIPAITEIEEIVL
jgi:hypothetical protein